MPLIGYGVAQSFGYMDITAANLKQIMPNAVKNVRRNPHFSVNAYVSANTRYVTPALSVVVVS